MLNVDLIFNSDKVSTDIMREIAVEHYVGENVVFYGYDTGARSHTDIRFAYIASWVFTDFEHRLVFVNPYGNRANKLGLSSWLRCTVGHDLIIDQLCVVKRINEFTWLATTKLEDILEWERPTYFDVLKLADMLRKGANP